MRDAGLPTGAPLPQPAAAPRRQMPLMCKPALSGSLLVHRPPEAACWLHAALTGELAAVLRRQISMLMWRPASMFKILLCR